MTEASGNQRDHALYAPSAAHRWMVCHASVKATAHLPSLSSAYAAEGTVAHHVLEQSLINGTDAAAHIGDIVDVEIEGKPSSLIVTKEMAEAVQVALDYLRPIIEKAQEWAPEQQVSLELFGAPDCYGTADFTAVIIIAGRILIADYKHGAGVLVEVEGNPQLKIYALGALLKYGKGSGISNVQTTIVQPRIPHPDGPIRSATYTIAELMDFGMDVLAAIDACEGPNPQYVPGEHCRWCGIEDSCAARAKETAGIIALVSDMEDGLVLSIEERERLLQQIDAMGLEDFIGSLRKAVFTHLESGGTSTRYKLVAKRASRVWLDQDKAIKKLAEFKHKKKVFAITDFYHMDLMSPAQVEGIIGKGVEARALIAGLTTSVSSGDTLAPIDDIRQASRVSAEDEFDALTPDE